MDFKTGMIKLDYKNILLIEWCMFADLILGITDDYKIYIL